MPLQVESNRVIQWLACGDTRKRFEAVFSLAVPMRVLLAACAMTFLAFAGCSGNDDAADNGDDPPSGSGSSTDTSTPEPTGPKTHDVKLEGNKFVNQSITINAGDSVKWTHMDGMTPHNIEEENEKWDSHPNCVALVPADPPCMISTSPPYTREFTEVGTVNYLCEIHPGMTGTINVIAAGAGNATTS